ncbi:hypothetical protein ILUMI_03972 [Ignelater luminosus]|uniref:Uncharacterized protein n=1 Tax=Ignelater luminosus TaxID=2038154 RepID=A0A8K0DAJ1_IGNLU|nr:hypothetical protein ILUMI_03972 [Ignelater luminosus]
MRLRALRKCTVNRFWKLERKSKFWEEEVPTYTDAMFKENFHVSRNMLNKLMQLLSCLTTQNTNLRPSIPLDKRLAIAMYALGSSAEYRTIAKSFWYGCHIEVCPPKSVAVDYYNYKGWYSIVLLAVPDHRLLKGLEVDIDNAPLIIKGCCTLSNFCNENDDDVPEHWIRDLRNVNNREQPVFVTTIGNNNNTTAENIRNAIAKHFVIDYWNFWSCNAKELLHLSLMLQGILIVLLSKAHFA